MAHFDFTPALLCVVLLGPLNSGWGLTVVLPCLRLIDVDDGNMEFCVVCLLLPLCLEWGDGAPVATLSSETPVSEDDQAFAEVKQASVIRGDKNIITKYLNTTDLEIIICVG